MNGTVAVVQYNAGNIRSVVCALNRLGIEPLVTDDPGKLREAGRVIFPGVGEAKSAMEYLDSRGLSKVLRELTQPFLGICLGLQLMCLHSEEHDTPVLGMFRENVLKFPPEDKVPHMGWNRITGLDNPLFAGIPEGSYVYFVHSYYVASGPDTIASCMYIRPFSAALGRGNFFGTQFHPEKSGAVGQQLLSNFLNLETDPRTRKE